MNFFEKHLKSPIIKHNLELNAAKSKSKENQKLLNLPGKDYPDNNEKRQYIFGKYNHEYDSVDHPKNAPKINGKDGYNIIKPNVNDIAMKSPESDCKNAKKVLYLEDNEIDEPYVPKSRNSSLNGVLSKLIVKRSSSSTPSPLVTTATAANATVVLEPITNRKPDNGVASKSLTDCANNLKRKSISMVIGNGQKKTKLSEKEAKVNPISVIESDQIRHLKKLIHSRSFDCSSNNFMKRNSFSELR